METKHKKALKVGLVVLATFTGIRAVQALIREAREHANKRRPGMVRR